MHLGKKIKKRKGGGDKSFTISGPNTFVHLTATPGAAAPAPAASASPAQAAQQQTPLSPNSSGAVRIRSAPAPLSPLDGDRSDGAHGALVPPLPLSPSSTPGVGPTSPKSGAQPLSSPTTAGGGEVREVLRAKDEEIGKLKIELAELRRQLSLANQRSAPVPSPATSSSLSSSAKKTGGADKTPQSSGEFNIQIARTDDGGNTESRLTQEVNELQRKYQEELAKRVKLEEKLAGVVNQESKMKLLQEGINEQIAEAKAARREAKRLQSELEAEIAKKTTAELRYHKKLQQARLLLTFVETLKHETQLLYRMVLIETEKKKGGEEEAKEVKKRFQEIDRYVMVSNVDFRKQFFVDEEDDPELEAAVRENLDDFQAKIERTARIAGGTDENEHRQEKEKDIAEDADGDDALYNNVGPSTRITQESHKTEEEEEAEELERSLLAANDATRSSSSSSSTESHGGEPARHPLLQTVSKRYRERLGTIIVPPTSPDTSAKNQQQGSRIGQVLELLGSTVEKNCWQYKQVVNELVHTERSYIADLELIVTEFKTPMLAQRIIAQEQARTVFGNVEEVAALNRHLLANIEAESRKDIPQQLMGQVFLEMAQSNRFDVYTEYCANHNRAREMINKILETNSAFATFLDQTRTRDTKKLMDVKCYLIKPLQRICKYPLLLREMLKFINEHHSDYAGIVSAVAKLQIVLNDINQYLLHSEKKLKLSKKRAHRQSTKN